MRLGLDAESLMDIFCTPYLSKARMDTSNYREIYAEIKMLRGVNCGLK